VIVGLSGGVAAWRIRNWQSDRWAFGRVASTADAALADAYARGGGLRVAELTNEVLPRARLAEAKRVAGHWRRAEAIERVLATHPAPAVVAEARSAHATALKDAVASERTVSGLRAFLARWPDSPEAPIAKAKVRSLYHEALADFRAHANVSDRSVAPVVEALLAHAGEHLLPIEVRFRQRTGSLATADGLLAKGLLEDDKPARGGGAPLARCFADEERREAAFAMGLQRSLRTVFPAELFALRVGARLDEPVTAPGAKPLAEVDAPTIVIDYEIGWAGTTYVARDSGRRFLGLFVSMQVTVQVPSDTHVLSFAVRGEAPEALPVQVATEDPMVQALVRPGAAPDLIDDARAYDAMLLRVFDEIGTKLLPVFFEPKTAAAREARQTSATPKQH
ncbi:MAG: hypothetical protein K0S65_4052, partial [Labilithrix sp.]|nr:hypothetical protein [Labilithrix sp.]